MPLIDAVRMGYSQFVRKRIERTPSVVGEKLSDGETYLIAAVRNGRVAVARLLLDAGADPRAVFQSQPCLFFAIYADSPSLVQDLLLRGASPNEAIDEGPKKGRTPLHEAAVSACLEICTILLSKGANVLAKDAENMTPAQIASKWGNATVADLLQAAQRLAEQRPASPPVPGHRPAPSSDPK